MENQDGQQQFLVQAVHPQHLPATKVRRRLQPVDPYQGEKHL